MLICSGSDSCETFTPACRGRKLAATFSCRLTSLSYAFWNLSQLYLDLSTAQITDAQQSFPHYQTSSRTWATAPESCLPIFDSQISNRGCYFRFRLALFDPNYTMLSFTARVGSRNTKPCSRLANYLEASRKCCRAT